jgi:sec-independent protein translocase protein TatB
MFDFSWTEILLIGVVALVVIGPKDLPKALKLLGFWVRKARTVSREFQSSIEQMMREAELDEVRKEVEKAASIDIEKEFKNTIDPTGSLEEQLKPPELPKLEEHPPATPPAAAGAGEAAGAPSPEPSLPPAAPHASPEVAHEPEPAHGDGAAPPKSASGA